MAIRVKKQRRFEALLEGCGEPTATGEGVDRALVTELSNLLEVSFEDALRVWVGMNTVIKRKLMRNEVVKLDIGEISLDGVTPYWVQRLDRASQGGTFDDLVGSPALLNCEGNGPVSVRVVMRGYYWFLRELNDKQLAYWKEDSTAYKGAWEAYIASGVKERLLEYEKLSELRKYIYYKKGLDETKKVEEVEGVVVSRKARVFGKDDVVGDDYDDISHFEDFNA